VCPDGKQSRLKSVTRISPSSHGVTPQPCSGAAYKPARKKRGPTHRPRTELDEPAPLSGYGRSKLAAEAAVRVFAGRVHSVILRPPILYRPGDRVNLPPLLAMARLGLFVKPGLRRRPFSFIHVEDLCLALEQALERGETVRPEELSRGVYFVADPDVHTWDGFCAALSLAIGCRRPARMLPLPEALAPAVGQVAEWIGRWTGEQPLLNRDKAREMVAEAWTCAPDRAIRELGFRSRWVPLQAGLEDAVGWYRAEGLIPYA